MTAWPTRLLVLGAVRFMQPTYGYDVRRELLSWGVEEWANIKPASIYSALRTLNKDGFIDKQDLKDILADLSTCRGRARAGQGPRLNTSRLLCTRVCARGDWQTSTPPRSTLTRCSARPLATSTLRCSSRSWASALAVRPPAPPPPPS